MTDLPLDPGPGPGKILLAGVEPRVDRAKIGISYSGGGPQLVVELGCAQAFVEEGIVPAVIAGVSAGALAGTAHALDPEHGRGVALAAEILGHVRRTTLKLAWYQVLLRFIAQNLHTVSLGDNAAIKSLVDEGLALDFGMSRPTIGAFRPPERPKLMVGATDRLNGTQVWLPEETALGDALVASSAIPGVFPWRHLTVSGRERTLVDGGVISNQPISRLALEGCGTIYAVAVGYGGGPAPPPTNLVDNLVQSIWMGMHQSSLLEEEYVSLKLGDNGVIHHIHPQVEFPIRSYDFTPQTVAQVMRDSAAATRAWLRGLPK
jgi:predicted acylesterase/phospholipase RssA